MQKIIIRTYCEASCDCPKCHTGDVNSKVEDCVYCQLKWYQVGEYDPKHPLYKNKKGVHYCECGNLVKDK